MAQGLAAGITQGKHNDGREGVHLTKVAQGDLVAVPFNNVTFSNGAGGSCGYATVAQQNPTVGRPISVSLPANVQAYATIKGQAFGRAIGLRAARHFAFTLPNMAFIVDGEVYPIRQWNTRLDTTPTSFSSQDGMTLLALADDLPNDGPHTWGISITGDASTAYNSLILFGLALESSKGIPLPPDPGRSFTTQTLSATAAAISATAPTKQLAFYNPDTVTHTVYFGTGTTAATAMRSLVIPAGQTATIDFPALVVASNYKVFQDAAPTTSGAWCVLSYLLDGWNQ